MDPQSPLPASTPLDFQLLLDNASDYALLLLDEGGIVREWSKGAERIFGWTREEILGQDGMLLFTPEDRERGEHEKEMALADQRRKAPDERWHLKKDGQRFWASGLLYRLLDAEGRVHGYAKILRDFTSQHRTAEALIESEKKLELFLENLEDHALFMMNPAGEIASWNRGAERLFGYAEGEAVGRPISLLCVAEDAQAGVAARELEEARASGKSHRERWLRRKDGARFWAAFATMPLADGEGVLRGFARIVRDASDRKRAEESRRMESIGRLAGGVAHDFNNMLTAINGYCELLLGEAHVPDGPREWIQEIQKAGDRAASLTRQLLAFSRRQVMAPSSIQLNDAIRTLEPLLRRTLGEDIRILTSLDPALDKVMLDQGHFEQVLLNLAINSREAMPGGGELVIDTANVTVGGSAPEPLPLEPGPYVRVRVRDTGLGMDQGIKARVFEPFFSTKAQGTGSTGLGLSTVYGTVRQSGGAITLDSEPGKGTEFRLYFPVSREAEAVRARHPAARGDGESAERTLLLVEDEHSVRKLTAQVLGMYGYRVVEAKDGAEAAAWLESHPDEVHLVLTDVVMPNVGGLELARRVQELRPGLPVIFMSGYTEEAVMPHGLLEKALFIQKPFTVPALLARVRDGLSTLRQAPR